MCPHVRAGSSVNALLLAGKTYAIRIDGNSEAKGTVTLKWSQVGKFCLCLRVD
jgi:hypothetical protein